MTPEGFNAVIPRVRPRREARGGGAEAIELTGTSLTFYQGEAFNQSCAKRSSMPRDCRRRR